MTLSSVSPETQLVVYCVVVLLAALAGGWLPALLHLNHARLQIAVSLVSGLMIGLAMLHLLPHGAEELGSTTKACSWLMAGFLVMFLLQRFLPFHHHEVESDDHGVACSSDGPHPHGDEALPTARPLSWIGVALGLSIHSLLDGLALAAAVLSARHGHGVAIGLGTAAAVILHKPFGAMAITTLVRASASPRHWLHWVNLIFALITPIGAALFFVGAGQFTEAHPDWLGAALAFSAGTFLCIACADLLPELQFHSHDRLKLSFALLVGLGIAILIGTFGHAEHGHAHDPAAQPVHGDDPDHDHDHEHPEAVEAH
jgi:zinc and cadmium transporter